LEAGVTTEQRHPDGPGVAESVVGCYGWIFAAAITRCELMNDNDNKPTSNVTNKDLTSLHP